jgi:DNA-binding beta-propeller fold protein YncE
MDVPEEQIFSNPVDIAISPEGQIYILDSKDNNIKIFQTDGSFIKTVGRGGSGPGEFQRPWIFQIIGDKIYVADSGNRRVQIITKNGEYERSYKAPISYGNGMALDTKGNLYLNTQGLRSPKLISAYDSKGNLIIEIGNLEGKTIEYYDFTLIKNQIKEGKVPDSFKNDVLLAVDNGGNLFAVHRALNKFKKYSLNGNLVAEIEIKAEEYKNIYKDFLKKNQSEKNPSIYWALYYVNDLALDNEGSLYILLNEQSKMTIYVYSINGLFTRKLLGVEDNIFRIAIHDNYLYALSQETHFIYKFALKYE